MTGSCWSALDLPSPIEKDITTTKHKAKYQKVKITDNSTEATRLVSNSITVRIALDKIKILKHIYRGTEKSVSKVQLIVWVPGLGGDTQVKEADACF